MRSAEPEGLFGTDGTREPFARSPREALAQQRAAQIEAADAAIRAKLAEIAKREGDD